MRMLNCISDRQQDARRKQCQEVKTERRSLGRSRYNNSPDQTFGCLRSGWTKSQCRRRAECNYVNMGNVEARASRVDRA